MNNALPADWKISTLSDLSSVITKGTTPTTNGYSYTKSGVKFFRVENISKGGKIIGDDLKYISKEANIALKRSQLKTGDLLISIAGAIGRSATVEEKHLPANTNQAVGIIRLIKGKVENDYIRFSFESPIVDKQIKDSQSGLAQINLNLEQLGGLRINLPPLPEQQKISAILTAVDDVIEFTQARINKLKDLKTGMMQELLTKGIGHTEFKDSPVGKIPKSWCTSKIQNLASFITSGSRGWAEYYSKTGPIFIRIGNLTREHINFRFSDVVYVNPPKNAEGDRTRVQPGDVLISITADLGIIGVVNDSIGEAYVNQHISLVRPKDFELARWIGYYLSHENSQKQFTSNNDSGAKSGLNLSAIRNLEIALPPNDEIRKIVMALDSIDGEILNKRKKISRSINLKKALMQDLLTGKVRVQVN